MLVTIFEVIGDRLHDKGRGGGFGLIVTSGECVITIHVSEYMCGKREVRCIYQVII